MWEDEFKEYNIEFNADDPMFVISVVAEMVGIPIWTLRKLDELGVVSPQRLGKKTRCYSPKQVKKLTYVYHLMNEKGVNISGIKMIFEIHEGGDSPR